MPRTAFPDGQTSRSHGPLEVSPWGRGRGPFSIQLVARMGRDRETGPLKKSSLGLNWRGCRPLEVLLTVCCNKILGTLKHDHGRQCGWVGPADSPCREALRLASARVRGWGLGRHCCQEQDLRAGLGAGPPGPLYPILSPSLTSTFPEQSGNLGSLGASHWSRRPSDTVGGEGQHVGGLGGAQVWGEGVSPGAHTALPLLGFLT